jgi:hypothetical protein
MRNDEMLFNALTESVRSIGSCDLFKFGKDELFYRYELNSNLWQLVPEGTYVVIDVSKDFNEQSDIRVRIGGEDWFEKEWQNRFCCTKVLDGEAGRMVYATDLARYTRHAFHYHCNLDNLPSISAVEGSVEQKNYQDFVKSGRACAVFQKFMWFVQDYCVDERNSVRVYPRLLEDEDGARTVVNGYDLYSLIFLYNGTLHKAFPVRWGDVVIGSWFPGCREGAPDIFCSDELKIEPFYKVKEQYDILT